MNTYSDSFHTKADKHVICQDHAIHSDGAGGDNYALLSDGCSSAFQSELGAYILTSSLSKYIQLGFDIRRAFYMGLGHANCVRQTLSLPQESLYATLLAVTGNNVFFQTSIVGDGIVVGRRRKDGAYKIIKREFHPLPAPYYPAYWLDVEEHDRYMEIFGQGNLHRDVIHLLADGTVENVIKDALFPVGSEQSTEPEVVMWLVNEYDMVAAFSDGLCGFYAESTGKSVPLEEVLKELLCFKNLPGAFVQRRMQMFFKRTAELGWKTADDVSCAGISHV